MDFRWLAGFFEAHRGALQFTINNRGLPTFELRFRVYTVNEAKQIISDLENDGIKARRYDAKIRIGNKNDIKIFLLSIKPHLRLRSRKELVDIMLTAIDLSKHDLRQRDGLKKMKEVFDRFKDINGRRNRFRRNKLGHIRSYSADFTDELKEKIRHKYDHRCASCGKSEKELKMALAVHHIDGNKQNNSEENLIPYCPKCHMKEEWKIINEFRRLK